MACRQVDNLLLTTTSATLDWAHHTQCSVGAALHSVPPLVTAQDLLQLVQAAAPHHLSPPQHWMVGPAEWLSLLSVTGSTK
jgi:hypothetical protein